MCGVATNHIVTVVLKLNGWIERTNWNNYRYFHSHMLICLSCRSHAHIVRWRRSRKLLRKRWCWRFTEMRVHTLSRSLLFWTRSGNFTSFAQKQLRSTISNSESWTAKNSWLSWPKQGFFSRWLARKEWECNMCVLPWSRRVSRPHATLRKGSCKWPLFHIGSESLTMPGPRLQVTASHWGCANLEVMTW